MDERAFASATRLASEIRDRRIGCVELLDFSCGMGAQHRHWDAGRGDAQLRRRRSCASLMTSVSSSL
jgi:hypothetical protein